MIEASRQRRLSRTQLVEMLSESLGAEKAGQVVSETTKRLGVDAYDYDREQALRILEAMAAQPGLVGVVARFAKARVIFALK
jgi:hypothetical protein